MALPHEVENWANEASSRKPKGARGEVAEVRAKTRLISRELLAEIEQRRASDDLSTLIPACEALLDALELA